MPRINVSKVIKSPKFVQTYTVFRKTGDWVSGRFVSTESQIKVSGVVTPPNAKEILQVPEGDRTTGVMCFHSTQELFVTRPEGTSDEIVWKGIRYRVSQVMPWIDYGYWKAFGVRMEGS
jgi:hypothetical protein